MYKTGWFYGPVFLYKTGWFYGPVFGIKLAGFMGRSVGALSLIHVGPCCCCGAFGANAALDEHVAILREHAPVVSAS